MKLNNMFSKKSILLSSLLAVGLTMNSCKKLIEIPANPPSSITREQQFADSLTAMSAVAGVYTYNAGKGFAFSDGRLTYTTGLSADELSYTQENDNQQFYSFTLDPLNSGVSSLWTYAYQSIYQVNDVLDGIQHNKQLSLSFQKRIGGEMRVLRALYYFNLVNLFGEVPLVTSIDYTKTYRIPRTELEPLYAFILEELSEAKKDLKESYPSDGRARPNRYAAVALEAKVNLYLGNWENAYQQADSVIKSGMYRLEPSLNKVFLSGSTEAIWQLPGQKSNNAVADAQVFVPPSATAMPNYLLLDNLLRAFESEDLRFQNWVAFKEVNGNKLYYPFKYKNVRATDIPKEDQMILRVAEMYLIRAEAAAHLNRLSEAVADIDSIRARAGLSKTKANPNLLQEVLQAISQERRIELFCEWGNRWYDLKRTGKAAEVLSTLKGGYTPDAALYPIPQAQRQLNYLLSQNPGYN